MAFRCTQCGGNILFAPEKQMMKCQHCGSLLDPETFRVENVSEETGEGDLVLYTCGGCGAELQGTEGSMVGFCPWCGGQSLLKSEKTEGGWTAETMIPFQVSRDRCRQRYTEFVKTVRYLPPEMRDPSHLENFVGIYMPFYRYDVVLPTISATGTKKTEFTDCTQVSTFRVEAKADGTYTGAPFDASRCFNDEMAARILPFNMEKETEYNPAYLSGFYADASTVPAKVYYDDAAKQAGADAMEKLRRLVRDKYDITIDWDEFMLDRRGRALRHHGLLLPVWFLTWRKGNRVAYAMVNGDSGKVVSDLPVDVKSFYLWCLAYAAAIFLLLELVFQPTLLATSLVSLAVAMVMALSTRFSALRIAGSRSHEGDKGWFGEKALEKKEKFPEEEPREYRSSMAGRKKPPKSGCLDIVLHYMILIVIAIFFEYFQKFIPLLALAAAVNAIVSFVKVLRLKKDLDEKQTVWASFLIMASVLVSAGVILVSPALDLWYYLADAVSIIVLILVTFLMLQSYNVRVMRPVPDLFERGKTE